MIGQQNVVFTASNLHSSECGSAPDLANADSGKYHGYFENEHGEQWVLVYDRQARRGVLRGGDAGWETECDVVGSEVRVALSPAEKAWLDACLRAVGVDR